MKKTKINPHRDRQFLPTQATHSGEAQGQEPAGSKSLPAARHESNNTIFQGSRCVSGAARSQLYAPGLSWERSQQQAVCSLLEGKKVVKARFRRGKGMMVLELHLEKSGEAVVIEPVMTNRGYHGLMITPGDERPASNFNRLNQPDRQEKL
jgi:hypothetical protein